MQQYYYIAPACIFNFYILDFIFEIYVLEKLSIIHVWGLVTARREPGLGCDGCSGGRQVRAGHVRPGGCWLDPVLAGLLSYQIF